MQLAKISKETESVSVETQGSLRSIPKDENMAAHLFLQYYDEFKSKGRGNYNVLRRLNNEFPESSYAKMARSLDYSKMTLLSNLVRYSHMAMSIIAARELLSGGDYELRLFLEIEEFIDSQIDIFDY